MSRPARPEAASEAAGRSLEPLAFRKKTAAALVGISVRTWERLLAAGKAPRPDARAGKAPLWTRATLERWLAQGGSQ